VDNVFFWKTPLAPGRNTVEVTDGHGHSDRARPGPPQLESRQSRARHRPPHRGPRPRLHRRMG